MHPMPLHPDRIEAQFRGPVGQFRLDAAFTIPATGVSAVFGPSGCGKTTVLRCMAGLHRIAEGRFSLAGEIWQDGTTFRPPWERSVGYVFQEASLFPHLSVRRNLLFGASRAGAPDGRGAIALDEVVELLGIDRLLDRAPQNLSGGERQRVAIGRALLSQPRILLMDEPLSALDRFTKDEILPFLERLHDALALPIVYVSHDLAEVERLADHLVLIENGRVRACGPLAELQSDTSLPLARARGAAVTLAAVTSGHDARYGLLWLEVDGGRFLVPSPPAAPGRSWRLRIEAGDVSLTISRPVDSSIVNVLPALIAEAAPLSEAELTVVLRLGRDGQGARLLARVTRLSWDQLGLAPGMTVFAQVKGVAPTPGRSRVGAAAPAQPSASSTA
jgi:molybdate transport system ATP-binding protein